jgi:hypothetical protein
MSDKTKVTVQEIENERRRSDYQCHLELCERIQQHGIAVDYTPMTDDELHKAKLDGYRACGRDVMPEEMAATGLRYVEQAVLARIGVAPQYADGCTLTDIKVLRDANFEFAKRECEREQSAPIIVEQDMGELYIDFSGHPHIKAGDRLCFALTPTLDQAMQICEQAGFAVVPSEPTDAMVRAGQVGGSSGFIRLVYKAMLEAAKDSSNG